MALGFVEGKVVTTDTTPAVTPAFTNALATGQVVVVFIGYDTAAAGLTTSVTDSKGNTYTNVPSFYTQGTGMTLDCWWTTVTAGHTGASPTISVAFNDASSSINVVAQIFNGFTGTPTYDKKSTSSNASSTSATSGATAATTQAVELVVGGAVHGGTASAYSLGSGYTNLTQSSVANMQVGMQSLVTSSTGAQTSILTIAAARVSVGGVITLYDASAGSPSSSVSPSASVSPSVSPSSSVSSSVSPSSSLSPSSSISRSISPSASVSPSSSISRSISPSSSISSSVSPSASSSPSSSFSASPSASPSPSAAPPDESGYTESVVKRYFYKIYDVNQRYVTTWSTDVISDPQFRQIINGGAGQMMIHLARPYDNFGEAVDVSLQNRVECWVADEDNLINNSMDSTLWNTARWDVDVWDTLVKSFVKIYTGYISAYSPILDGERQYIEVTVLGYITEATYRILKDSSGNTTITYTSTDPGNILKDVINKYRADGGINISYVGTSVQLTGTAVSYTFKNNTLKECFDKIVQMCPNGWYWFLDTNGIIYLQQSSLTADHRLTIGKDISLLQTNKRIENIGNVVYLIGGGNPNLFNKYSRQGSISTYGKFEVKINDGSVTDNTTADVMAKNYLDRNQSPETRTLLKITDNNGENSNLGQNIENFSIGDTIQIKNLNYGSTSTSLWNASSWDIDVWDSTINYSTASILTIQSIQYYPNYIEIEASNRLPDINRVIQDLKTTQTMLLQQNLPTVPTERSV